MSWESSTKSLADDLPGFEIVRETGVGAMGRVFVARQTKLDRLVALKFLAMNSDVDTEEQIARFRREAEIMAGLKHPNVLPIFDFIEDDGRFYLSMEYVEDGDLRKRMPIGQGMSPADALAILVPVGEALSYLHAQGILHRDLKPENILMQAGVPKVADFGIAVERSGSGDLTRTNLGMGTLGYVAPEVQYRLPVDERADQYSLAAMAYEMLTGTRPLGLFKAPSVLNPCLGDEVDRVLFRALEESPEDRYPSVMAFIDALRHSFEVKNIREPKKTPSWNRTGFAVVAALIATVAVAAFWFHRPPRREPPAWPTSTSTTLVEVVTWHARQIWFSQGRPQGEVGEAVQRYNWESAEKQVIAELTPIAIEIWNERPPPHPWEMTRENFVQSIWSEAETRLKQKWQSDPSRRVEEEVGDEEDQP